MTARRPSPLIMAGAFAVGLALLGPFFGGAQAQAPSDEQALQILKEAEAALDGGRASEGARLARSAIDAPYFSGLSARTRYGILAALAEARAREPGCAQALAPARERTAAPGAGELEWSLLLAQTVECGEYGAAAGVLTTMIERFPLAVGGARDSAVFRASAYLRDSASLSFLIDERPPEPDTDVSSVRLQLVRVYLAEQRQDLAVEAAHRFASNGRDLGAIVEFLVDRTFDPVVRAEPAVFNFEALSERQLANVFNHASAAPDRLGAVHSLATALYFRGRLTEALAVIDNALMRIETARGDAPAFVDLDENLNWAHDVRSDILRRMGRHDEARAALAEGAKAAEQGRSANISQTLNHAGLLLSQGRPDETLRILDHFDLALASPYGRNVARSLRACAYAVRGDEAAMRRALADIAAHGDDSPVQLRYAALCAGDLDLAASAFIRQFDHPFERRWALLSLQTFAGEGAPQGIEKELLKRSDVRSAIERAAHTRSFSILRPY